MIPFFLPCYAPSDKLNLAFISLRHLIRILDLVNLSATQYTQII